MGHMGALQKVRNIRRDPRVSLSCLGQQTNEMGLLTHVVAYGEARVTEGGAADLLRRPAQISMGPHLVFRPEPYRSNLGTSRASIRCDVEAWALAVRHKARHTALGRDFLEEYMVNPRRRSRAAVGGSFAHPIEFNDQSYRW